MGRTSSASASPSRSGAPFLPLLFVMSICVRIDGVGPGCPDDDEGVEAYLGH